MTYSGYFFILFTVLKDYLDFLMEAYYFIKILCKQKVKTFFLSSLIALLQVGTTLYRTGHRCLMPLQGLSVRVKQPTHLNNLIIKNLSLKLLNESNLVNL